MKTLSWMMGVLLLFTQAGSLAQFEDEDYVPPMESSGNGGSSAIKPSPLTEQQRKKLSEAGIEDITSKNFPETIESFDFQNADIADVVKAISELTGKNFIIDPGVRGKITITAPSKITVAEAYKAFLSALAINGLALVPSGEFLKVRSARDAQRDGVETYPGDYYPNADQMITKIIHLKYVQAESVQRDIRILTSKFGELAFNNSTNSLIISDYGSNIDRIVSIINALDVPGFEDQMEVIRVNFAKAKDIAELVNKIVNKGDTRPQAGGAFSAGIPRFSRTPTNTTQGGASFTVIPDDRSNSLIVVGNKAGIDKIKGLLKKLDFKMNPEDQGGVYVYYMQYGDAEKVAQTLTGIAKDAGPKPATGGLPTSPIVSPISGVQAPQQELFGSDVKITADKNTNSLVIVASKTDYETVKSILAKIDIPRDQVFVETIFMEMGATDSNDYKVGFFQFQGSAGAKAGFNGFTETSLSDLLSPAGGTGAIIPFGTGSSTVTITPPGGTAVTVPSLLGFINFLKENKNANVLSTPQILAMDNQTALIEVGDKIAVSTKTETSANGQTSKSANFEDATIKMEIKPSISTTSNTVRMELETNIKQLSNVRAPPGLSQEVQNLGTRKVKTTIVVPNGDTAVLGGLMKENDNERVTKVPLLGDIPILGWLFKSRSSSKEKTNLLVFLTPKIIRNTEDSKSLLSRKLDQRLEFVKGAGGKDPYGSTVNELRAKASEPAQLPGDEEMLDESVE